MNKALVFFTVIFYILLKSLHAQTAHKHAQPHQRNPILPGYFADPTVKKIGDTYYLYATTDGNGWGAGPSTVWTSKDFVNWTVRQMNWPNTHWYWAPDMTKGYDGRYYLYYSQPVELFGAVSDTPIGPWKSLAEGDKAIIPNYKIPGVITLDGQTFTDDDGRIYMLWGTWGIYPDHGCAVGLLHADMKSFERIERIPNTVAIDFFEAPVMFKRDDVYYLLYSSGHCEDHTYRVQYVKSQNGPFGPYEYPEVNPILSTNEDGTIHGPGHNDVLEIDGRYYIVYHRHNNPHSGGGFHRQVAVDELLFDAEGNILKVVPTHEGIGFLGPDSRPFYDMAFGKQIKASSFYSEEFCPEYAVDANNGTLWRAANNSGDAWLEVDLARMEHIQSIVLEMEYPTYAYQYVIEVSADGCDWSMFKDNSDNNRWASPIIDKGDAYARYVRVRIIHTQKKGLPRGIWNLKVFGERLEEETLWSLPQNMPEKTKDRGSLIHIQASDYQESQRLKAVQNKGMLGGSLVSEQEILVKQYAGKKSFYFDGTASLRSKLVVPESLKDNSAYTVEMWVNNPTIERFESLVAWSNGKQDLGRAVFGFGSDTKRGAVTHGSWADLGYNALPIADEWHQVVISFDGYMECIYVDGMLQSEQNRMLFIQPGSSFVIGASDLLDEYFSGYLACLKVHNRSLSADSIRSAYVKQTQESSGYFSLQTDDVKFGSVNALKNHGALGADGICIDEGSVHVLASKTALNAKAIRSEFLRTLLNGGIYTLDFGVYDGERWRHYLYVNKNESEILCYVDGKWHPEENVDNWLDIKSGTVYPKRPLHFLNVYPQAFGPEQVVDRYQVWSEKSNSDLKEYQPALLSNLRYINGDAVFVQIEKDLESLQYLFSCDSASCGWLSNPYYLFSGGVSVSPIHVYAKDYFGNVSKVREAHVIPEKPKLVLEKNHNEEYVAFTESLPYWDGYHVSPYVDSTMTDIRLEGGIWHIRSKNTKWGDTELTAPFIYKELEGDFTIEVRIKDVSGLAGQNRTSSEAGIMVQKAGQPLSYLNNSILTGWNIGNLARSVGEGVYQEGSTGTGLGFATYIQIQKVGAAFFLRYSHDGVSWQDIPRTPFLREDLNNQKLKVGLYQIAGSNQVGYGAFDDVKLYVN